MSIDRDNGVKVGDIITAYCKGYHVVVAIIPRSREQFNADGRSLIEYRPILDSKFNPVKSKRIKQCDASYCKVWTKDMILAEKAKQIEYFSKGYDLLLTNCKN